MELLRYLTSGKWAVIQTPNRHIYLINRNDFSDCGSISCLLDDYPTIEEFCKKGVFAWKAMPDINDAMPPVCRKFTAAFELLQNRPEARAALCKFDRDDFGHPLHAIVIAALAVGIRTRNKTKKSKSKIIK